MRGWSAAVGVLVGVAWCLYNEQSANGVNASSVLGFIVVGAAVINLTRTPFQRRTEEVDSSSDDDYVNCLNGYITISPVSMSIQRERNLEMLKKVKF